MRTTIAHSISSLAAARQIRAANDQFILFAIVDRERTVRGHRPAVPSLLRAAVRARIVGAAAAGALTAISLAPGGPGWAAPLGVAGAAVATRDVGARRCAGLGWTYGAVLFLVHLGWLASAIHAAAWIALAVTLGGWSALATLALRRVQHLPGGWLLGAGAWIGVEQLRSSWPLGGMPWAQLGFSAVDTPWQGALTLAGVPGAGLLVAAAGCALARAVVVRHDERTRRARFGPAGMTGLGLAGLVTASVVMVACAVAPDPPPYGPTGDAQPPGPQTLTVALVQGGVPGDGTVIAPYHREVTLSHARLTDRISDRVAAGTAPPVDLVLWPENATASDPRHEPALAQAIRSAAARVGAPILVGSMMDGPRDDLMANQTVAWSPEGPTGATYTKRHPVPFGERLPARALLERLLGPVDALPRDAVAGPSDPAPLLLGGTRVAAAICFDIAYGDTVAHQVRAGAEVVFVQTSNATFFGTAQPEQQLAITRTRAVETGRAIVVASPNGASAVIAPDGRVVERLPAGVPASTVATVPLRRDLTPAMQGGRRLSEAGSVGALGAVALLALLARRRTASDARDLSTTP
ncbi:apolipoprotein N-acyltransferase [Nocardioides zeae]